MRFFNEFIEVRKTGQKIPHWEQPGATYFITWRLDDSIPQELMDKWVREREAWLLENPKPWEDGQEEEYHRIFSMEIMRLLDKGYGSHYDLHAWVAMPNHVHVLFSAAEGELLEKLVGGWKKFIARRINVMLGQEGKLWQKNYFDTMIRDWDHMFRAARYVRRNPRKLREGEFTLYEAEWVKKMLG